MEMALPLPSLSFGSTTSGSSTASTSFECLDSFSQQEFFKAAMESRVPYLMLDGLLPFVDSSFGSLPLLKNSSSFSAFSESSLSIEAGKALLTDTSTGLSSFQGPTLSLRNNMAGNLAGSSLSKISADILSLSSNFNITAISDSKRGLACQSIQKEASKFSDACMTDFRLAEQTIFHSLNDGTNAGVQSCTVTGLEKALRSQFVGQWNPSRFLNLSQASNLHSAVKFLGAADNPTGSLEGSLRKEDITNCEKLPKFCSAVVKFTKTEEANGNIGEGTSSVSDPSASSLVENVTKKRNGRQKVKLEDTCALAATKENMCKNAASQEHKAKRWRTERTETGSENPKAKVEKSNDEDPQDSVAKSRDKRAKHPEEKPQDYVHVRARRGQATDSHSLAERARREKISQRMKFLQSLVPGCSKVTGKAVMLDEIINYVQSLQCQVEFMSAKLASVWPRIDMDVDAILNKEICQARVCEPKTLSTQENIHASAASYKPSHYSKCPSIHGLCS